LDKDFFDTEDTEGIILPVEGDKDPPVALGGIFGLQRQLLTVMNKARRSTF